LLLLVIAINKQLALKIIRGIFTFLHKIRIIKSLDKSLNWVTTQVGMFNDSSKIAMKNPGVVIKTFILSVFQLSFFFLIPYCIYRSFGLQGAPVLSMVAAQAFVVMVSVVIPLPGGSGGAEGSFYLFFSIFFSSAGILSAILIWRLITYYSNIVICGLFVTLDSRRTNKISAQKPAA
ncbi:MAG: lysylphosphatidylglycerol synthase transmembrane domain-containing protein, partial [Christensenellales bacterium]